MTNLGKIDTITKEYMRDPAVFADAFNQFIYHGRPVIKPENLAELDTTEISLPYGDSGAGIPEQRYRDVLKLMMTDGCAAYCMLGIENQSAVHYAVPVKNLAYESMQLARQVAETARSHKRKKLERTSGTKAAEHPPSPDEYLSGFYKTDRLLPVMTLTIFWSPDKWDGPLALKEMFSAADDAVMRHVPDYKVSLLAPGQMPEHEIRKFRSSLKEVMLYIKYSKDRKKLQDIIQQYPKFHNLDRMAAEVINAATNSKLKFPEGEETVDMCLAIEEMRMDSMREGRREGMREGIIKGIVETYIEFNLPLQEAVQRIADKFSLSLQESENKVKKYWK